MHALQVEGFLRKFSGVYRGRASLEFSTRSLLTPCKEGLRISRFSRRSVPYMLGASDRAGSDQTSPNRSDRCCLPHPPTSSAPRMGISRLNTQPAHTPVNASRSSLLKTLYDSGPVWLVNPLLYGSFIHSNPLVYPGAIRR